MAHPRYDKVLIGGLWQEADQGVYTVTNPETETPAGEAPSCSVSQVEAAVAAAREAFDHGPWPRLSREERSAMLHRAAQRFSEAVPELLDLTINETGAVRGVAEQLHLGMAATRMEYYADMANLDRDVQVPAIEVDAGAAGAAATQGLIAKDPVGVVAVISPYNAPVLVSAGKIGPALAMGNTIVVKPPPAAPMGVLELCRIIAQELPPGVVNVVSGEGAEIGEALVAGPIDMVSFTGSSAVGRHIQQVCGQRMKRSLMELGGKSAMLIFADCDMEAALKGAMATWSFQSGQACIAPTRLLIERSIYDEFTARLASAAADLKIGSPRDESVVLGPLISRAQLERVEEYVSSGLEEGAVLACGGRRPPGLERGFYYEPTLFTGVNNTMRIAREEIFGPVVVAIPFDSQDEAIEIANDSDYGLSGYVWSSDVERAIEVARSMRTGSVQINGTPPRPDTPFGGFKQSGIGRDNGLYAIGAYTEMKFIGFPPL